MFTRPSDIADSDITAVLAEGWAVDVAQVEHTPVGFGSHHWIASDGTRRRFVTVDDLEESRRDEAETLAEAALHHTKALELARALRDLGLDFVIAPVPTSAGSVTHPVKGSYVAAVYPYVDGTDYSWGRFDDRDHPMAVLDRVAAIHEASPHVAGKGRIDDRVIPKTAPCQHDQHTDGGGSRRLGHGIDRPTRTRSLDADR